MKTKYIKLSQNFIFRGQISLYSCINVMCIINGGNKMFANKAKGRRWNTFIY